MDNVCKDINFKVNYLIVVYKNKIVVFNKVYVRICKLYL